MAATFKSAGVRESVPPVSAKMIMSIYNKQMSKLSQSLDNEADNHYVSTVGLNEKLEMSFQYHQQTEPQVAETVLSNDFIDNKRWEGVLCTLQKPTLHNLADKY